MKSTVVIGLAALMLLAACNKSGGGDQANNGGGDANANAPAASAAGGDEKITLAQFQQRQVDRIMRYDTNHDGKVTKDEFVAAMKERIAERQAQNGGDDSGAPAPDPQAIADRMFARMDTNGQGFITKDEVEKSTAAQFAQLDTDHKGYITRDEMRARFAARGGGQGGPPGGGGGQGGGDNGGGGGGN
jgi:Ca2+-binding EF-hand superfamily protein